MSLFKKNTVFIVAMTAVMITSSASYARRSTPSPIRTTASAIQRNAGAILKRGTLGGAGTLIFAGGYTIHRIDPALGYPLMATGASLATQALNPNKLTKARVGTAVGSSLGFGAAVFMSNPEIWRNPPPPNWGMPTGLLKFAPLVAAGTLIEAAAFGISNMIPHRPNRKL